MARIARSLTYLVGMLLCSSFAEPLKAAEAPDEKAQCAAQMKKIYQAIQDYRKEHKALPNWLSDLSSDYVSDPSVFVCPVERRTGSAQRYELGGPSYTRS